MNYNNLQLLMLMVTFKIQNFFYNLIKADSLSLSKKREF